MSIFQYSLNLSTKVSSSIVMLQEKNKTKQNKQNEKIYREVESQLRHHYSFLWQGTDHTVHGVLAPRVLEWFAVPSSSEQHLVS